MKDYELFFGPFSAHAYSVGEVFTLIETAYKLHFLDDREHDDVVKVACDFISKDDLVMKGISKFSIHDRKK